MKWIKDHMFIRGKVPMTKFNIRILTIGYLEIQPGDRFLDIGGGTGSISIEASLQGAKVWTVEREEKAIDTIKANDKKFNTNLNIIHGQANVDLPKIYFNKCFVGGSRGQLEEIFEHLDIYLENHGILSANFITLKNLNQFIELMEKYNYKDVEVQLVQTSERDEIGLLKGHNPVFIVKGVKDND